VCSTKEAISCEEYRIKPNENNKVTIKEVYSAHCEKWGISVDACPYSEFQEIFPLINHMYKNARIGVQLDLVKKVLLDGKFKKWNILKNTENEKFDEILIAIVLLTKTETNGDSNRTRLVITDGVCVKSTVYIAEDDFRVSRGSVLSFKKKDLKSSENGDLQLTEFTTEIMEFEGLCQILKDVVFKNKKSHENRNKMSISVSMESDLSSLALKPEIAGNYKNLENGNLKNKNTTKSIRSKLICPRKHQKHSKITKTTKISTYQKQQNSTCLTIP